MSITAPSNNRNPEVFLSAVKRLLGESPVTSHRFLRDFACYTVERRALEGFATQWYKTARRHKEAFPALIWNTRSDDVRFDLIDILYEEYGRGERGQIHARLLERFLACIGISVADVDRAPTLTAVTAFGDQVLAIWKDGDPAVGFGLHFALEYLAAHLHTSFATGLEKYPFLLPLDREYFEYHRTAEQVHADFSEGGFRWYAQDSRNHEALHAGVTKGVSLLTDLLDGFHKHVFERNYNRPFEARDTS